MTALILTPDRDTPGKRDYTGAFRPGSLALQRACAARGEAAMVRRIDVSEPPARRLEQVLRVVAEFREQHPAPGDVWVAFLCHGWSRGLQIGLARSSVRGFVRALGREPARVTLYACSSGGPTKSSGDGSLADALRDEVARQHGDSSSAGVVVDAHTTRGHAYQNPYVRRFARDHSRFGGTGGQWIVAPGSTLWRRWVRALRTGDLAFEFPLLTTAQIHNRLTAAG